MLQDSTSSAANLKSRATKPKAKPLRDNESVTPKKFVKISVSEKQKSAQKETTVMAQGKSSKNTDKSSNDADGHKKTKVKEMRNCWVGNLMK